MFQDKLQLQDMTATNKQIKITISENCSFVNSISISNDDRDRDRHEAGSWIMDHDS
jgi:hypothetical protein